jgi:hypothetical protein
MSVLTSIRDQHPFVYAREKSAFVFSNVML